MNAPAAALTIGLGLLALWLVCRELRRPRHRPWSVAPPQDGAAGPCRCDCECDCFPQGVTLNGVVYDEVTGIDQAAWDALFPPQPMPQHHNWPCGLTNQIVPPGDGCDGFVGCWYDDPHARPVDPSLPRHLRHGTSRN